MTTQVEVEVTVNNVRWNGDAGWYEGDFKYKQTSPKGGMKIVDQQGNINGRAENAGKTPIGDFEITLLWKSDTVKVNGVDCDAHLRQPNNKSIRLAKSFGDKPNADAGQNGGVISVPGGNGNTSLTIRDQNNDGEIYTYNLVAEIETSDGPKPLVDDPIIINQDPPQFLMYKAEAAVPAEPGQAGEAAQPATPAIPPEPDPKP